MALSVVLFSHCHSVDTRYVQMSTSEPPSHGNARKYRMKLHSFADFLPVFCLYLAKFLSSKVQQPSQSHPLCVCWRKREGVCVWQKIKSCKFAVLLVNPSILAHTLHHPFHLSEDWCVACMENKHVLQMHVSNAMQGLDPGVYLCARSTPYFIVNISTDNS